MKLVQINLSLKIVLIFLSLLILNILGIVLLNNVHAQTTSVSFGASPATISNQFLLPGSEFTQDIVLSRSQPDTETVAEFVVDAPEIESWLIFQPDKTVTMPKGEQRVKAKLMVKVPEDAKLGDYSGYVRVRLGEEDQTGQVILTPAVRLDLIFTVTDQQFGDIKVLMSDIGDFEKNNPLKLYLTLKNDGNIKSGPEKVTLLVTDLLKNPVKELEALLDAKVAPFSTEKVTVNFKDHNLELGQYFAKVKVYFNDQVIYEADLTFDVKEESAVPATGDTARDNLQQLQTVLVATFVVLLTVSVGAYVFTKKSETQKKSLQPS
ncbi:MAG TPA: hypothetical protein VJC17_01150 [Candidatus Dojkabacteria bacterium]|nr:hypothetical protein [Candidatus Dojkabacteria bacterium]